MGKHNRPPEKWYGGNTWKGYENKSRSHYPNYTTPKQRNKWGRRNIPQGPTPEPPDIPWWTSDRFGIIVLVLSCLVVWVSVMWALWDHLGRLFGAVWGWLTG